MLKPRYQILYGYAYPINVRENNCIELDYSLDEISLGYPNFHPPMCECGEIHSFSESESVHHLKALAKNPLNRFTHNKSKKIYYDYNSKETGKPLTSNFLNLLPTNGTFYIRGSFLEIEEQGFTVVEPFALTTDVYILNKKYTNISLEHLKIEHFVNIQKLKLTDAPSIISLPFGTYLFSYGYSYYILSIKRN